MIQDRRKQEPSKTRKSTRSAVAGDSGTTEPVRKEIDLISSWKMQAKDSNQEDFVRVGLLTIRVLGYVFDQIPDDNRAKTAREKAKEAAQEDNKPEEDEENDQNEDEGE